MVSLMSPSVYYYTLHTYTMLFLSLFQGIDHIAFAQAHLQQLQVWSVHVQMVVVFVMFCFVLFCFVLSLSTCKNSPMVWHR